MRSWSIRHRVAPATVAPFVAVGLTLAPRQPSGPTVAPARIATERAQHEQRRGQQRGADSSPHLRTPPGNSAGMVAEEGNQVSPSGAAHPTSMPVGRPTSSARCPEWRRRPAGARARSILLRTLGGRPMAGHQVLVLRIGVRIPAPQLAGGAGPAAPRPGGPIARGNRARVRRANSIPSVTAPIVLILAAGQGTRMRSKMPKVLHELCGSPMVLWPVRAALDAGAGKVVVVDSPARALEPVLPAGVELAVQERPNGTGGAVASAMSHLDGESAVGGAGSGAGRDRDTPVVVLSGDVPARQRRGDSRADRGARAERRGRHDGDDGPRRPQRLRAGRARRERSGRAGGRDQGERRRDGRGAPDLRGEHRHLRVRRASARAGAAAPEHRQRAGRAVPAAGARPAEGRRRNAGAPTSSTTPGWCSGSTTGWPSRRSRGSRRRRSTNGTCAPG